MDKKNNDRERKKDRPDSNRKGKRIGSSPIRPIKVLELKAEIETIEKENPGITVNELIWEVFKDRDSIDRSVSSREFQLAFDPEDTKLDRKTKTETPTEESMLRFRIMMGAFRKFKLNKSVVVYGDLVWNETKGLYEWLWYRFRNLKQYKDVNKRLQKVGHSILERNEDNIAILSKSKAEQERLDREFEVRLKQKSRRRRMSSGDYYK